MAKNKWKGEGSIGNVRSIRLKLSEATGKAIRIRGGEFPFEVGDVLDMLFEAETLYALREASLFSMPWSWSPSYEIDPRIHLGIDFRDLGVLTPAPHCLKYRPNPELSEYLNEAYKIYRKFEEVKAVVQWLNSQSVPAVRYLFPAIIQLAPETRPAKAPLPVRYDVPWDIAMWLPRLRSAAITVAEMAFLPEETPASKSKIRLTFCGRAIEEVGAQLYMTEAVTVNL